jgi:LysM repeat protein
MKRRTRLIIIGCAVAGTFPTAAQAASATPNAGSDFRPVQPAYQNYLTVSASTTSQPPVRATTTALVSEAPPRVHAPVLRVTVKPGDTLSAIGARTSRTWEQLASYNHVPNPNLIYPDQVITIPPANYVAVAVADPEPVVTTGYTAPASSEPAKTWSSSTPAATRATYTPPAPTPAPAPVASASTGSGIWSCIAAHESGGNPATNTGNGFYGMYQDTQGSWASGGGLAYAPSANMASAAEQTIVNEHIQAQQGWGAWPVTSRMCGV